MPAPSIVITGFSISSDPTTMNFGITISHPAEILQICGIIALQHGGVHMHGAYRPVCMNEAIYRF